MEDQKVNMAAVKYCAIIMLLFVYNTCTAQVVSGKYYGDDGLIYHFEEDSFRTVTRYVGFHSSKKIERGTYKISGDTLYLDFKPLTASTESYFKFIKKDSVSTHYKNSSELVSLLVNFTVVDRKGQSLPHTNLLIQRKNNHLVRGFVADSLGKFPEIFIFGNFNGKFRFSFVGYDPLKIDADKLAGFDSKVKVILMPDITYSKYDGTKKYIIEERGEGIIVLEHIKNKQEIVLKRKDSN